MPILFKSKLSSAVANATWVDKTIDDATVGKFSLRESSSANIEDIQLFLNTLRSDVNSNDVELADHETRISDNELQLIDHETRIGTNETNIGTNTTNIGTNATDIQAIEDSVGAVNGIAPLDANAEVPLANLPQSVQDGLSLQGNWNADTNTPDLVAATPDAGNYWIVSVAGTTDLDGIIEWGVNDWAVYTVNGWAKMDFSNAVTSVNGQSGVVVLDKTDIGLTNVTDDAQLKRAAGDINTFTEKATPVDADIVLIEDSEDSFNKKKVLLSNMLGGGGAGGGGSFVWELNGDISPLEETLSGISALSFDFESESEIWAFIQVPESYGSDQIKLLGAAFTSAGGGASVPGAFSSVVVAPGDFAIEPGGIDDNLDGFTITADNEGTAGDFIDIMPDGSNSVSGLVDLWNLSNPTNTATVVFDGGIDNFEIPVMGTLFSMSGGVDPSASDNVLFRCQTFLNRSGQVLNYQNHISTNTEVALLTPNVINVISEIDLTDVNGEINFVQVLPNDYIAIRLYRDIANETTSSTNDARFLKFSASISFTE